MLFSTNFLAEFFPNNKGVVNDNLPINEVTTDSTTLSNKSLFIPVKTDYDDGHEFLMDAFYNGAIATMWEMDRDLPSFLPTDFPVFYVEDSELALKELTRNYLHTVNPQVIGIAGIQDRESTKELTTSALKKNFSISPTSRISTITELCLAVLAMDKETEVLILDLEINQPGDIKSYSEIVTLDVVVITDIGELESKYHSSKLENAQTSMEVLALLKDGGHLILDGDERVFLDIKDLKNVITVGYKSFNDTVIVFDSPITSIYRNKAIDKQIELNDDLKTKEKQIAFAIEIATNLQVEIDVILDALREELSKKT